MKLLDIVIRYFIIRHLSISDKRGKMQIMLQVYNGYTSSCACSHSQEIVNRKSLSISPANHANSLCRSSFHWFPSIVALTSHFLELKVLDFIGIRQ